MKSIVYFNKKLEVKKLLSKNEQRQLKQQKLLEASNKQKLIDFCISLQEQNTKLMKVQQSKSVNQTHTKPTFKTSESLFGENSEIKQALEKEQKVVRTMLGLEQLNFSNIKLRKKEHKEGLSPMDIMISHR